MIVRFSPVFPSLRFFSPFYHDNTDPERFPSSPDQLEKDSLVERPDPSQAKNEVLISNLFDRIRTS